jgi:hypothetical protein
MFVARRQSQINDILLRSGERIHCKMHTAGESFVRAGISERMAGREGAALRNVDRELVCHGPSPCRGS